MLSKPLICVPVCVCVGDGADSCHQPVHTSELPKVSFLHCRLPYSKCNVVLSRYALPVTCEAPLEL
jgi:hypothetical protein